MTSIGCCHPFNFNYLFFIRTILIHHRPVRDQVIGITLTPTIREIIMQAVPQSLNIVTNIQVLKKVRKELHYTILGKFKN
jgi:hypothetical protein